MLIMTLYGQAGEDGDRISSASCCILASQFFITAPADNNQSRSALTSTAAVAEMVYGQALLK